jgi:hypothetical protein
MHRIHHHAMAFRPFGCGDDVVAKTYELRTCLIDVGHVIERSINCIARRVVFVLCNIFDYINRP